MKKRHFKQRVSEDDYFNCFLEHALAILYRRRAELNRIICYLQRCHGDRALKTELKQQ
jgi:hypothetical protein